MICVVDDDISVLCSLQEVLASDGLEAQAFDDPEKFVDYARTHTVKLAVLDYAMPVLNGLQPQDRLRVQSSDTRLHHYGPGRADNSSHCIERRRLCF
jgi:FixJ family two-component response regulator